MSNRVLVCWAFSINLFGLQKIKQVFILDTQTLRLDQGSLQCHLTGSPSQIHSICSRPEQSVMTHLNVRLCYETFWQHLPPVLGSQSCLAASFFHDHLSHLLCHLALLSSQHMIASSSLPAGEHLCHGNPAVSCRGHPRGLVCWPLASCSYQLQCIIIDNHAVALWCIHVQVLKLEASKQWLLSICEITFQQLYNSPQRLDCKQIVPCVVLCSIVWLYLDGNVDVVGDADVVRDVLIVNTAVMSWVALTSCCDCWCAWLLFLQVPFDIGFQLVWVFMASWT